jgi:hypothetical protein
MRPCAACGDGISDMGRCGGKRREIEAWKSWSAMRMRGVHVGSWTWGVWGPDSVGISEAVLVLRSRCVLLAQQREGLRSQREW